MLSFFSTPAGCVRDLRRRFQAGRLLKVAMMAGAFLTPLLAKAAVPVITSKSSLDLYYSPEGGQDGLYFGFLVTASGSPTRFEASGLPSWCTFNTTTGNIFGTRSTPGIANVTVSATNAEGTGTGSLQIRVHPAVLGVTSPSGVFFPGDTLHFRVEFNEPVFVTGLPRLKIRVGSESFREAGYYAGSGTTVLDFSYLVAANDSGGDVLVLGLEENGGAIADTNHLGAGMTLPLRYQRATASVEPRISATGRPTLTTQPLSVAANAGAQVMLTAVGASSDASYQWQLNGVNLSAASSGTLTIAAADSASTGVYTAVVTESGASTMSDPAVVGVTTSGKLLGSATEVGTDIHHQNGNVYDQVLLTGPSASVTADAGQITRISFTDLSDDIVQVEFAGAGTLSISLENYSAPAPAANYNQPGVAYAKGHARIVVAGANESTYLSVFSVGRANALNPALFRDGVDYDGVADIASIAVLSANGKFGGVFAGNASFVSTSGVTGILAPQVEFTQTIAIGDISAADSAVPVLLLGGANTVRVAGGDFFQANGRAVQVSGFAQLQFAAGVTSDNQALPAQTIQGHLEENGQDVTLRMATAATQ